MHLVVRPNGSGTTLLSEQTSPITYLHKNCYIQMGPSNVSVTGLSTIDNALNNVSL
jgi:hypothetical protein